MKKARVFMLLLIGACFVFSANSVLAQKVVSGPEETIAFSDPSKPGRVDIRWNNGKVIIRGYDGNEVKIERTDKDREDREERAKSRGLRRVFMGDAIEYEESNNRIDISCFSNPKSVNVLISVPNNTFVSFENKLYGSVEIERISGEIEVQTAYGEIKLDRVTGPVVAYSTYGDIAAMLENVVTESPMSFKSGYSDIDLSLPVDIKATLDLSTTDAIWVAEEFQMDRDRESRRRSTKRSVFRVNGGGVEIEISSNYGSIFIRKNR
ncbi:MAG: DUF4097 domain-containing protein [bacterium]|nr:DUF4097 domain-containing protein [bacterium]